MSKKLKELAKRETVEALVGEESLKMGFKQAWDFVDTIFTYARRVQSLNEVQCNTGFSDRQQKTSDNLDIKIECLCKQYGIQVEVNGDPRGSPIKLTLPSGKRNSFFERVWCVNVY